MREAACRAEDPALFFPEGRGSGPSAAAAVCHGCPVRTDCLAYAHEHDVSDGVWGGENFASRRRAPSPRAPVHCGQHPERPAVAHGLCTTCYGRWRRRRRGSSAHSAAL
ncbi:MAG: WhiB family transcriptional regulator [Actinobacteria bacterium]|nr:WhiB family transcriptional regulator [Actinomycetota bacterium]